MTGKLLIMSRSFELFCLISWTTSKMCIYMNMNVESHLPLATNLLHLYLYCVQIRSSVSSYRVPVNSSSALGLAPGSPNTRIWKESVLLFQPLRKKKYLMGNHLKPEEEIFCVPLTPFSKTYGASFHWQWIGTNHSQFGKTKPLWKVSRRESRDQIWGTEVMSSTGSCPAIQPTIIGYSLVKPHKTNQTYSILSLFGASFLSHWMQRNWWGNVWN